MIPLYDEFELPNEHPLIVSLNKLVEWAKTSDVESKIYGEERDDQGTKENLAGRMSGEIKSSKAHNSRFDRHKGYDFTEVEERSSDLYRNRTGDHKGVQVTVAKTWYPPNGYIGWHIDGNGGRLYSTWAEGKSFFRYRCPETGEIVTSWDKPNQWLFRIFKFDKEKPLWHCVCAEDLRISIGYKFEGGV